MTKEDQVIQRVVLSTTTAGFRLSNAAVANIARLKKLEPVETLDDDRLIGWGDPEVPGSEVMFWNIDRSDRDLLETLASLGPEAGLPGVIFKIVFAPKDEWEVGLIDLPDGGQVETLKRIKR